MVMVSNGDGSDQGVYIDEVLTPEIILFSFFFSFFFLDRPLPF